MTQKKRGRQRGRVVLLREIPLGMRETYALHIVLGALFHRLRYMRSQPFFARQWTGILRNYVRPLALALAGTIADLSSGPDGKKGLPGLPTGTDLDTYLNAVYGFFVGQFVEDKRSPSQRFQDRLLERIAGIPEVAGTVRMMLEACGRFPVEAGLGAPRSKSDWDTEVTEADLWAHGVPEENRIEALVLKQFMVWSHSALVVFLRHNENGTLGFRLRAIALKLVESDDESADPGRSVAEVGANQRALQFRIARALISALMAEKADPKSGRHDSIVSKVFDILLGPSIKRSDIDSKYPRCDDALRRKIRLEARPRGAIVQGLVHEIVTTFEFPADPRGLMFRDNCHVAQVVCPRTGKLGTPEVVGDNGAPVLRCPFCKRPMSWRTHRIVPLRVHVAGPIRNLDRIQDGEAVLLAAHWLLGCPSDTTIQFAIHGSTRKNQKAAAGALPASPAAAGGVAIDSNTSASQQGEVRIKRKEYEGFLKNLGRWERDKVMGAFHLHPRNGKWATKCLLCTAAKRGHIRGIHEGPRSERAVTVLFWLGPPEDLRPARGPWKAQLWIIEDAIRAMREEYPGGAGEGFEKTAGILVDLNPPGRGGIENLRRVRRLLEEWGESKGAAGEFEKKAGGDIAIVWKNRDGRANRDVSDPYKKSLGQVLEELADRIRPESMPYGMEKDLQPKDQPKRGGEFHA